MAPKRHLQRHEYLGVAHHWPIGAKINTDDPPGAESTLIRFSDSRQSHDTFVAVFPEPQ